MSRLLALDSSTEACSAALLLDGAVTERFTVQPRRHSELLLPMVQALLAESGSRLSSAGPGSFTGLRIAIGVVQGLAFGADLPVIPVSTLAALAQTYCNKVSIAPGTQILAAIDARMDEVYWAQFLWGEDQHLEVLRDDTLGAPEAVQSQRIAQGALVGVGSGWRYRERIPLTSACTELDEQCLPRAAAVAQIAQYEWQAGRWRSAEQALPRYLRDQVAWQRRAG